MSAFIGIRNTFESLRPLMDERMCRLWAANEARRLGWGGITLVAEATGLSPKTITAGLRDLDQLAVSSTDTRRKQQPRYRAGNARLTRRIRRPGAGRKRIEIKHPMIETTLDQLIANDVAGDPMSEQKWVRLSLVTLSNMLKEHGYHASRSVVGRLLRKMGFSLKTNKRTQVRSKCPERDEQFRYIALQRQTFGNKGLPIVSVDTKKKELIGNFRNPGQSWCRQAYEVNEHDFPSGAECRAVPFGIYDVTRNEGHVTVGVSHDTPAFAITAIARWWKEHGRAAHGRSTELLILADGGGTNGCRSKAWKLNLQEQVCDMLGLTVTVCHYPTGCSKWNPIEHRLFSQISRNWAGKPLRSLRIMLGYIRGTTTSTGLKVKAFLDEGIYKRCQKVTREEMDKLNLTRHKVCPQWNYTLRPRP